MSYLPPGYALLPASAVEHRVHPAARERCQLVRTASAATGQQRGCRSVDRSQQHPDRHIAGGGRVDLVDFAIAGHVELWQREGRASGEVEHHQPGTPTAAAYTRVGQIGGEHYAATGLDLRIGDDTLAGAQAE